MGRIPARADARRDEAKVLPQRLAQQWRFLRGTDHAIERAFAGEVGLTGEIRPVNRIEQRIAEAQKLGFKEIYLSKYIKGVDFARFEIKIHQIERVEKMIRTLFSS